MFVDAERYEDTAILPERFETLTLKMMEPDSFVAVNPERLVVDMSGKCFLDTRAPLDEPPIDSNIWVFKFFDGWYIDIHGLDITFTPVEVEDVHPNGESYLDPIQAIIHQPQDVIDLAYYFWRRTKQEVYSAEHLRGLASGSYYTEKQRRTSRLINFWSQLLRSDRKQQRTPSTNL